MVPRNHSDLLAIFTCINNPVGTQIEFAHANSTFALPQRELFTLLLLVVVD
jgi:hypothetical protein